MARSRADTVGFIGNHESNHLYEMGLEIAERLKRNGPQATQATKQFLHKLVYTDASVNEAAAKLLAEIRSSKEAQEGINAFFEKRPAAWIEK